MISNNHAFAEPIDKDRRDLMSTRIITLDFGTANDLYSAYMPFIKNGGLFIATKENFKLGERVFLDIRIMKEPDRQKVEAKVVWVTPSGAQGGKPAGTGVRFEQEKEAALLRNKIETHLAGSLQSSNPTNTM